MAKADILTKDGTKILVEGGADEVAAILLKLGAPAGGQSQPAHPITAQKQTKSQAESVALVAGLIAEGFFKQPRELGVVRQALEERGYFYPVTTLSPLLLRLVKRKQLRRIKDKKRWTYVQ